MKRVFYLAILSCISFAGCATLENKLESPTHEKEGTFDEKYQRWWHVFNDPIMDELVEKLVHQNLDLQIAITRVKEARAVANQSESSLFPEMSISGSTSRSNQGPGLVSPQTLSQGGLNTEWVLDIFGVNKASINASHARLKASEANAEDVKRLVVAELIQAIIEWRSAHQVLSETQNLLDKQNEQVTLINARVQAGLVNAILLERAQAQRAQTATLLPIATASLKKAQYLIERLLGQRPDSLLNYFIQSERLPLSVPEPTHALGVPVKMIRQRPDLQASYYNLIAAQEDLQKAEAMLWPNISLSAFFGVQDTSKGLSAVTSSNPIWSIAGALTAPLINFGRLRYAIDAAEARVERAIIDYENVLVFALQQARTALSDYLNNVNAMHQQAAALRYRHETVVLAEERFKRGLTDMTDLTTAQTEFDQATIELVERKASAALAYIRLQRSLGL